MGEFTNNYKLFMPGGFDPMADVKTNLTDNLVKLSTRGNPTVIEAGQPLPQSGDYELGDRVFRNDPQATPSWPSSYILVCKDEVWGWHWRPVQQIISPWVDIPAGAIDLADWELHPTAKPQIALDSKGWCHWRGAVRKTTPGIPSNSAINVFKSIPEGIRPGTHIMFTVAINPEMSGTGKAGNVGGRFYLNYVGYSSFRVYNTDNGVSQNIWLDGLQYNNSAHWYYHA